MSGGIVTLLKLDPLKPAEAHLGLVLNAWSRVDSIMETSTATNILASVAVGRSKIKGYFILVLQYYKA
jgi:hypothetical protein